MIVHLDVVVETVEDPDDRDEYKGLEKEFFSGLFNP